MKPRNKTISSLKLHTYKLWYGEKQATIKPKDFIEQEAFFTKKIGIKQLRALAKWATETANWMEK